MEKFMFLFRGSDVYQPGQSTEAIQALKQKLMHWVGDLSKKGLHIASEPLQPTGKQVSGSKKTVTDGPFGETKENIGGCTIVQAKDINEAVEIAKGCPILESNANIEIRPLQKAGL
ncbi:YciI family protein [Flavitalea flava]